jgi:hypothetical protein
MSFPGCFYIKPIRQPMINNPPEIVEPTSNPATKLVFGRQFTLQVYATDPDGDDLWFEWPDLVDVDHTPIRYAEGDLWVGGATVNDLAALPGTRIRALVHDGHGNVVTVNWDLEFQ